MTSISFPAMGTQIEAWGARDETGEELRRFIENVEGTCSRFRPESELSLINSASGSSHELSPQLADLMAAASRAREMTSGLVDAGIGAALIDWGYDRTFTEVTDLADTPKALGSPHWEVQGRHLVCAPGTAIDLGGIAKGWACDRAVETGLAQVVSAGGDMRSAHPGTMVGILEAAGGLAARMHIGVAALATSSISKRVWTVADRTVNHMVDPRTMSPVRSPVSSATVVADMAVDAEAGAKAVLLLGEEGLEWADGQDWVQAAIVVWHDGSVYATGAEVAA